MNQGRVLPQSEWKLHWPLLLAATIGVSFGSIPTVTMGLFMQPLQDAFGWSRTTISLGMSVNSLVVTVLTPFAGALVDRSGSRRVAIPGLALCGLAYAAFALMTGAVWLYIGVWILYALASLLIRTMVWNPPVSSAFVANRGVAIAILLSGMSLASSTAPLLAHTLIESFGWRAAFVGIGIGWTAVSLMLVIPFFHDSRSRTQPAVDAKSAVAAPRALPGGLTGKEALRNVAILRIAVAGLLATTLSSAWGFHMVPIYTSFGVSRAAGASLAIVAGVAGVVSKLVVGSIADRVNSPFIPFLALTTPALGYAVLLASGGQSDVAILATAALVGIGGGATLHIIMYLTTQYGGLRNFGKIYGSVSALFGLAAAVGPVTAGAIFDATGDYRLYLMIGIPMFIVAGLLVFGLGPYPTFETQEAEATPA